MTKKLIVLITLIVFLILTFSDEFSDGVKYYKDGDYKNALSSFEKVKDKDSRTFFNIGNCYYRLNNIPKAAAYYLKSLRINPGLREAMQNLRLISGEDLMFHSTIFIPFPRASVYVINLLVLGLFMILIFLKAIRKKTGMTHLMATVAIFTIILSFYSLFAYVNSLKEYAIIDKHTQVLSSPSTDGVEIAEVFPGNVMDVEIRGKNYSKIKNHQGISGWINNSELIFVDDL